MVRCAAGPHGGPFKRRRRGWVESLHRTAAATAASHFPTARFGTRCAPHIPHPPCPSTTPAVLHRAWAVAMVRLG